MKVCKECGETKTLDDFYKHKKMADGYLNKCKVCVNEKVEKYQELNREKIKEAVKKKSKDPNRVASRKKYAKSEKGKIAQKKAMTLYKERYPIKRLAHSIVWSKLLTGKLIKQSSCSKCGSNEKIEAHHDDYTKPLELRWLCEKCHKEWHKYNKAIYF